MKILFLCHGNICRSPMAEFVMKYLLAEAGRDDVVVESAALHTDEIGNDVHPGTRAKLRAMGVPFAPRAAWLLTAAKAREYDLLIGMDAYNMADLRRLVWPEDLGKVRKLLSFTGSGRDVADPWYTGNFDATWDDVLAGCRALLAALPPRRGGSAAPTNYHTHTTWCDGKDTPEAMARAACEKGFAELGFSSHVSFPEGGEFVLDPRRGGDYAADVRRVKDLFAGRLEIRLGAEADYIPGVTAPERERYRDLGLEYLIGSIHYVVAPDGARVPVDHTPRLLADGVRDHFGGRAEDFVRAYFRQQREMVSRFDFDIVGHLDLVRKFNLKHPYFDETDGWYLEELAATADAVAASGKLAEVNTGAISRGWLDDAYPSAAFRDLLRARGVPFVLSSDAHAAESVDCAFDRFGPAEEYVRPSFAGGPRACRRS